MLKISSRLRFDMVAVEKAGMIFRLMSADPGSGDRFSLVLGARRRRGQGRIPSRSAESAPGTRDQGRCFIGTSIEIVIGAVFAGGADEEPQEMGAHMTFD